MTEALTSLNFITFENLLPVFCTQYLKQKPLLCACSCWLLEGCCHKHGAEGLPMLPLQCFTYSGHAKGYDNLKSNIDCFLLMQSRTLFTLIFFLAVWACDWLSRIRLGYLSKFSLPSCWMLLLWQSPCVPCPFMYLQWVTNQFYVLPIYGNKMCNVPSHTCQLPFNSVGTRVPKCFYGWSRSIQTAVWATCPFLANIFQGNWSNWLQRDVVVYGVFSKG